MSPRTILVTGAAGFIGAAVSEKLLARGDAVIGVDNLSDYYDVGLKEARLALLTPDKNFAFRKLDISDRDGIVGPDRRRQAVEDAARLADRRPE